jgi:excinuclease ABC subunit A
MAQGTPAEVLANEASLTGQYMSAAEDPGAGQAKRNRLGEQPDPQVIRIAGASGNNLKDVTVEIPVGLLTCVTGVSGSGKSTLVNDTLYAAVARELYRAHESRRRTRRSRASSTSTR